MEAAPEADRPSLRVVSVEPISCEPLVTVTAWSEAGRTLFVEEHRLVQGGAALSLPGESRRVEVSSPLHEPCAVEIAPGVRSTCLLRGLRVTDPFPGKPGALFFRNSTDQPPFARVHPLPTECGSGFALPKGALDLVAAPLGGPADLYLSPSLPEVRKPHGPNVASSLRAKFVDSSGRPLTSRAKVTVDIPVKASPRDRAVHDAWTAFVSQSATSQTGNEILISPLPAPQLVFLVEFPGMPVVRLANKGMPVDGVLDLGEIRVPAHTRLKVQLRVEESIDRSDIAVRPSLVQPLPGIHRSAGAVPGWTSWAGEPLVFEVFPGEWNVEVRSKGMPIGGRRVELADGGLFEMDPIDVVVRELAGRVVDSRGDGIPDAKILISRSGSPRAETPDALSDDAGRFRASILHAGGVVGVSAWRPGDGLGTLVLDVDPASPSSTDLRIEMPSGSLSLRLEDERSGQAVSDARVELRIAREDGTHVSGRAPSPAGVVTVADLGDAKVEAEIEARGYEVETVAVTLRAGEDVTRRVRLRRGGRARGRVVRSGGSPISGATIAGPLTPSTAYREPPRELTDSEGEFEIEVPATGEGAFVIWAPGYRATFVNLESKNDGRRIVLAERGPDSVLELVEADGSPIRGAVALISPAGLDLDAAAEFIEVAIEGCGARLPRTNNAGQTALGGCLAFGNYQLHVSRIREGRFVADPVGSFPVPLPPLVRLTAPGRSR